MVYIYSHLSDRINSLKYQVEKIQGLKNQSLCQKLTFFIYFLIFQFEFEYSNSNHEACSTLPTILSLYKVRNQHNFLLSIIKLFVHIYDFISYSRPNGWTKLAKICLRKHMGTLGVTQAKQNRFFFKVSLKFLRKRRALCFLVNKNLRSLK